MHNAAILSRDTSGRVNVQSCVRPGALETGSGALLGGIIESHLVTVTRSTVYRALAHAGTRAHAAAPTAAATATATASTPTRSTS